MQSFRCKIVKIAVATFLIILVLCGIALRALNDKTTHKFNSGSYKSCV